MRPAAASGQRCAVSGAGTLSGGPRWLGVVRACKASGDSLDPTSHGPCSVLQPPAPGPQPTAAAAPSSSRQPLAGCHELGAWETAVEGGWMDFTVHGLRRGAHTQVDINVPPASSCNTSTRGQGPAKIQTEREREKPRTDPTSQLQLNLMGGSAREPAVRAGLRCVSREGAGPWGGGLGRLCQCTAGAHCVQLQFLSTRARSCQDPNRESQEAENRPHAPANSN
jgi:hypothetical protein